MEPTLATDDHVEWSIDITASEADGKPARLFVSVDDSGLLEVSRCKVTSRSDKAKRLEGGERPVGWLTPEQRDWLRVALREAYTVQLQRGWSK